MSLDSTFNSFFNDLNLYDSLWISKPMNINDSNGIFNDWLSEIFIWTKRVGIVQGSLIQCYNFNLFCTYIFLKLPCQSDGQYLVIRLSTREIDMEIVVDEVYFRCPHVSTAPRGPTGSGENVAHLERKREFLLILNLCTYFLSTGQNFFLVIICSNLYKKLFT